MKEHRGEIAANLIDIVTVDDIRLQQDVWKSFKKLRPHLEGEGLRWFMYRCPSLAQEVLEWGLEQKLLGTKDLYWIVANVPAASEAACEHLQNTIGSFKAERVDQQKLEEVPDLSPAEETSLWKSVTRNPRPDEFDYSLELEMTELIRLVRYSSTHRMDAALRLLTRFRDNESLRKYCFTMGFEDPAIFIAITTAGWQIPPVHPENQLVLELVTACRQSERVMP